MVLLMERNLKVYPQNTYHIQLQSYEAEQTSKSKTGKDSDTPNIWHSTVTLNQNSCQEENKTMTLCLKCEEVIILSHQSYELCPQTLWTAFSSLALGHCQHTSLQEVGICSASLFPEMLTYLRECTVKSAETKLTMLSVEGLMNCSAEMTISN